MGKVEQLFRINLIFPIEITLENRYENDDLTRFSLV